MNRRKILIAYFSATGTTRAVAQGAARDLGTDLFEIRPKVLYTPADLRWTNPLSRCNKEKITGKAIPLAGSMMTLQEWDLILVGFPLWYGAAPNVVNTFCDQMDWEKRSVGVFATSGGSGIGKSGEKLLKHMKGATLLGSSIVKNAGDLTVWARSLREPAT